MENSIENDCFIVPLWWITRITHNIEERDALSLINGYSQGKQGKFTGAMTYIARWIMCSRQTAIKTMQSLEELGYITKETNLTNGVTFNSFFINKEICEQVVKKLDELGFDDIREYEKSLAKENDKKVGVKNLDMVSTDLTGCQISLQGCQKSLQGCQKSLHNNNIKNNKYISSSTNVTEDDVFIQDKSFINTTLSHNNAREKELFEEEVVVETIVVEEVKKTAKEKKEDERLKREDAFKNELNSYKSSNGGEFDDLMVDDFFNYWTEPNKSGSKMRWEMQTTFDIKRRLVTWQNNESKYGTRSNVATSARCDGGSQCQRGVNGGTYVNKFDLSRQSYASATAFANATHSGKM